MDAPLAGQVALVTGASRGIGRATALRLAREGARIFINFLRDEAAAQETLRLIREQQGLADILRFDIADETAAVAGVGEVLATGGRLDVLVNNAGIAIDSLVLRQKTDEWERIMAVNLRGAFHCARAAARSMLRARYGRVINLSSVSAQMGNAGQAAYAAAKAGIIGFSKSMARELASRGITVNVVAPGMIETDMLADLPEARRSEYLSVIPVGRLGSVEEVAYTVAFLARPEAGYITGQVISVNGGLYM